MTIDRAHVQRWLDRYVAAWFSYDAAEIGDLFSADAEYRYHPYDKDPVKGRAAIVADWLHPAGSADNRDKPGTVDAIYAPYAVEAVRAVIVGRTDYRESPGGPIVRAYENAWLLEFDADGRCSSFTGYYMQQKT